ARQLGPAAEPAVLRVDDPGDPGIRVAGNRDPGDQVAPDAGDQEAAEGDRDPQPDADPAGRLEWLAEQGEHGDGDRDRRESEGERGVQAHAPAQHLPVPEAMEEVDLLHALIVLAAFHICAAFRWVWLPMK